MKKTMLRPLAVILAVIMLATVFAGCNRDGDDPNNPVETPEFVFMPEFIPLPEGITDISNLIVVGDRLYFTSWYMSAEEPYTYGNKLFSMNFDGTNLQELVNYNPGEPPEEGAQGSININGLRADLDGNLWVVENGNFFIFDLPDDFYDDIDYDPDEEDEDGTGSGGGGIARPLPAGAIARSVSGSSSGAVFRSVAVDSPMPMSGRNMYDYYRELENIMAVRKLDSTGAELLSVDISPLSNNVEWFWVRTFAIDGDGNIFIATDQTIFVLDNDGKLRFQLDVPNWIDQLITMPDGSVAFFGWGTLAACCE